MNRHHDVVNVLIAAGTDVNMAAKLNVTVTPLV